MLFFGPARCQLKGGIEPLSWSTPNLHGGRFSVNLSEDANLWVSILPPKKNKKKLAQSKWEDPPQLLPLTFLQAHNFLVGPTTWWNLTELQKRPGSCWVHVGTSRNFHCFHTSKGTADPEERKPFSNPTKKNVAGMILLMEEILHQLIGSLSHYL